MILALDLGTKSGWAVGAKSVEASGTWNMTPRRFDGGGMRYLRFRAHLTEIKAHGVSRVYFEEVRRHSSTDAAHVYGGLMATLTAWCEEHSIPYAGVSVGRIKKFWTGKGNASKDDMLLEASVRGITVGDDNECDAIALLTCILAEGE